MHLSGNEGKLWGFGNNGVSTGGEDVGALGGGVGGQRVGMGRRVGCGE